MDHRSATKGANNSLSVVLGTSKLARLVLRTGAISTKRSFFVRRQVGSIFGEKSKIVRTPVSGTRMLQRDNWQNNLTKCVRIRRRATS